MISDEEVLAPSLNREGWGGSPVGLPFLWHPCGTRDTLSERVPALYTKAMWHPCTLKSKISRARARMFFRELFGNLVIFV